MARGHWCHIIWGQRIPVSMHHISTTISSSSSFFLSMSLWNETMVAVPPLPPVPGADAAPTQPTRKRTKRGDSRDVPGAVVHALAHTIMGNIQPHTCLAT
eukprot:scaffold22145_cov107-Skeletonema_marinoi.AAC.2